MTIDELLAREARRRFPRVVSQQDTVTPRDEGTWVVDRSGGPIVSYRLGRGTREDEVAHPDEASAVARLLPVVEREDEPVAPVGPAERAARRAATTAQVGAQVRAQVQASLCAAGLADRLALVDDDRSSEGVWVGVVRASGALDIGSVDHGVFAPYASSVGPSRVVDVVKVLASGPRPPVESLSAADAHALGRVTSAAIVSRTAARGGSPGPTAVAMGELLDVVGSDAQQRLFAATTPLAQRAQTPSTVTREYHAYRVAGPLDGQEGLAAPWFGQPGGGAMVVLTRPVRWYVDEGLLIEVTVA